MLIIICAQSCLLCTKTKPFGAKNCDSGAYQRGHRIEAAVDDINSWIASIL